MGWVGPSRLNEWSHEPLEHRIQQARTEAADEWADEFAQGLVAGAGAGPEAHIAHPGLSLMPHRGEGHITDLAASPAGRVSDLGFGASSRTHPTTAHGAEEKVTRDEG
jgi:ribosomal protein S18 acetylase RimI-like enzyme